MRMKITVTPINWAGEKLKKRKFDVDATNITSGLEQAIQQQKAKFPDKYPQPVGTPIVRAVKETPDEKKKRLLDSIDKILQKYITETLSSDAPEKLVPSVVDAALEPDKQLSRVMNAITKIANIKTNLSSPEHLHRTLNDAQRDSVRSRNLLEGRIGAPVRSIRESVERTEDALEDAVSYIRALENILAHHNLVIPRVQRESQAALHFLQEFVDTDRRAKRAEKMGPYAYKSPFGDDDV